jgi:hypothetical protein
MKIFESRKLMIDFYVTTNLVGAEIGVFEGNFSEFLIKKNPKKLYLVDLFDGVWGSGDVDGNNFRYTDLGAIYLNLKKKFSSNQNVEIFKGASDIFFNNLSDNNLDYIYIDADHSYEGVKKDLENSRLKVKRDGYIFGHDYSINKSKTNQLYFFGVQKAVDEFCLKYKLEIEAIANDGCTSFCIKNIK